ncbi:30S ribosomal protein S17 [Candidatus Saccharibacteria bacterium]|nr:30S ribosomal protein S17 [Candidatus Saccharibacteria bacterium]
MPQVITGVVSSDKADKSIVVSAARRQTHPIYRKQYKTLTKYMAHDQANEAKVGDLVRITACRPTSARKRFKLTKILERAGAAFVESDATADLPEEQKSEVRNLKPAEEKPGTKTEPITPKTNSKKEKIE